MANHNAKGRPRLGRVRKQVTLPPSLVDRLNSLCQQQDLNFSCAIEKLLCYALESPNYDDHQNNPPAKPHG